MLEASEQYFQWWLQLEPQWKQAYKEGFFGKQDEPSSEDIEKIFQSPALRFAGPSAPYPNMTFELTNLSGITGLPNIEILVVTHQLIETIEEIRTLKKLRSLFLFNNHIINIEPLQDLISIEQLYLQSNKIESILPVKKLTHLKEFYINNNLISSLEGLTEEHADTLVHFFCKPNDALRQKELIKIERELGIKCREL